MKTFREWLRESELNADAETIISEDYVLKSIKKFKLKKNNFAFMENKARGYKKLGIAIDKDIHIYYLTGLQKVKIEFPNSTKVNIEQRETYGVSGKDRSGFVFSGDLRSKLLEFCSKLIKEIDEHWLDKDIKEKQPKYPDLLV